MSNKELNWIELKTKIYRQESFFFSDFWGGYCYCQSDLLLKLGISSGIHLQANYRTNLRRLWAIGFSVWYRNKQRNLKNNQRSCSQQHIHVKGDEIRFGRFTGKSFNCLFNLNTLMKLVKSFLLTNANYMKGLLYFIYLTCS